MALVSHATAIIQANEKGGPQSEAGLHLLEAPVKAVLDWPQRFLPHRAVTLAGVEDLLFDPLINPEVELVWWPRSLSLAAEPQVAGVLGYGSSSPPSSKGRLGESRTPSCTVHPPLRGGTEYHATTVVVLLAFSY